MRELDLEDWYLEISLISVQYMNQYEKQSGVTIYIS